MRQKEIASGLLGLTLLLGIAACNSAPQSNVPSVVQAPEVAQEEVAEVAPQAVNTVTVSHRVPNSESDAEEYGGTQYTTSTVLELTGKSVNGSTVNQQVGVRFLGVNVPKGARIKSAYIEFKAALNLSGPSALTIYGDDNQSGAPFIASELPISGRIKTTAKVDWKPGPWEDSKLYNSADLSPIVQEITNRSDWAAGHAMVFLISGTGERKALAYDSNSATAPRLVVTYETGTVTPPPPPSTSCLGSSPVKTGAKTITGTSYVIRGQTNYRLDAAGLLVKSPKSQVKDGKPVPRQAIVLGSNKTTPQNPVSVCLNGADVEIVGLAVNEKWEPYYHGSGAFYVSGAPGAIIENVSSIRNGDGFTIKDMETKDKNKIIEELKTPIVVRNSYIGRAGDDGVENDRLNNVTVDNLLIDSAYQGFSCQQETSNNDLRRTINNGKRKFIIKNTLLGMRREKAVVNGKTTYSERESYKLWKFGTGKEVPGNRNPNNTNCELYLENNVFLITTKNSPYGKDQKVFIDPSEYDGVSDKPLIYSACKDNTIVYTGGNKDYWAYLQKSAAQHPNCWKVTQDVNVWKTARANWFKAHPRFAKFEANEAGRYEFR